MKGKASSYLGYSGPEWDEKSRSMSHPNFWKYSVANLVFLDFIKNRKRILDIGCGTAGSTLFVAEHASVDHIIGIDPVKSMIEVANQNALQRRLNHKTSFVICDGKCLPFKQFCFDGLISRGDAFVFLVPQKLALHEFKRVLKNGAMLVIEIDNVRWKPGKTIFHGFEKLIDGRVAYSIEHFNSRRNHVKTIYILNPKGTIFNQIRQDEALIQKGKLERLFPLKKIREEAIETKHSLVTHWPTVDELKKLFSEEGFAKIEILGDGLLMGLLLEGDQKIVNAMKKQPELFFEIEKRLLRFIDAKKSHTIILKAVVPP